MTVDQGSSADGEDSVIDDSAIGASRSLRLGTSTYSYWHFTAQKTPIETVLEEAAELGLNGVEILHRQMESEENAYLQRLKRRAFSLGLDLYNLSIHQDFVHDDAAVRQQQIDHTLRCIDLAHEMGIPSLRVNSGGFRKQGSFDDLIKAKGWVEPWEGFTIDNGFDWVIDALERCLPRAEERGVLLLLENHWGLTTFAQDMARIIETIDSPWLQAILDMGNFLSRRGYVRGDGAHRAPCAAGPCQDLSRRRLLVFPRSGLCPHLSHSAGSGLAWLLFNRDGRRGGGRDRDAQECGDVAAGVGTGRLSLPWRLVHGWRASNSVNLFETEPDSGVKWPK